LGFVVLGFDFIAPDFDIVAPGLEFVAPGWEIVACGREGRPRLDPGGGGAGPATKSLKNLPERTDLTGAPD
jgi:hypothetical protein